MGEGTVGGGLLCLGVAEKVRILHHTAFRMSTMLANRVVLNFFFIMFTFSCKSHIKSLLLKIQQFLVLLLHSISLQKIYSKGIFIVKKLSKIMRLTSHQWSFDGNYSLISQRGTIRWLQRVTFPPPWPKIIKYKNFFSIFNF